MAAILKVWRHIRNPSMRYLLEAQSCQISSRSDLKRRSLSEFPNQNERWRIATEMWVTILNQFLQLPNRIYTVRNNDFSRNAGELLFHLHYTAWSGGCIQNSIIECVRYALHEVVQCTVLLAHLCKAGERSTGGKVGKSKTKSYA